MAKHRQEPNEDRASAPSVLGDLLRAQGFTPTTLEPVPAAPPGKGEITLAGAGKIVVRRERKGRGGKTVTLVTGIDRPAAALQSIAKALRKALGCGATVEGTTIVVQGDQTERITEWLTANGATRVVRGA